MERSDNPFLPPASDTHVTHKRRRFEISPLRALENHLSILFNMTLTVFASIGVMMLGQYASSHGYRPVYHLSMMATIPLGIAVYLVPVHTWGCARCCESALGRWSGRLSVVLIPLVVFLDTPFRTALLPILVAVAIAAFAVMLTTIALQVEARRTAMLAVCSGMLAIGLAGMMTQMPANFLNGTTSRGLHGGLVLVNFVVVYLLRREFRQAMWAQRYDRSSRLTEKTDPSD